jgi:hypothetical protein
MITIRFGMSLDLNLQPKTIRKKYPIWNCYKLIQYGKKIKINPDPNYLIDIHTAVEINFFQINRLYKKTVLRNFLFMEVLDLT